MRISAKSLALFAAASTMQLIFDLPVATAETLLTEVVPPSDKIVADGLQHCEGHCKKSDHCADGLKCISFDDKGSKERFEASLRRFGCIGSINYSDNSGYCINPERKVDGSFEAFTTTASPTERPTLSPTDNPTLTPTTTAPITSPTKITSDAIKAPNGVASTGGNGIRGPAAQEASPVRFTAMTTSPPTVQPTSSPTQTPQPTVDPYKPNEPPEDIPGGYFDYSNGKFGLKNWGDVKAGKTENFKLWEEFGEYIKPDLEDNMCDKNSKTGRQSPIDLRFDKISAQCFEYHQIRSKPGEWGIAHPRVEKIIRPSSLRVQYPRKFEGGFDGADENDMVKGPSADMPKQWGKQLPVLHADVKIPSEHYMEGKQYAAEYQISMIQNREDKQRGAPIVSVLLDIHPAEQDHIRFGQMIAEFQKVYDADMAACEDFRRKQRRLGAWAETALNVDDSRSTAEEERSTWLDEPAEEEENFQADLGNLRRKAQEVKRWNPFHYSILTTDWFYGYEGSLTEPPCSEFVEWRIMLEPALISTKQLNQMKNILFNHVNEKCERTSVHSKEHGVARPLQSYNGREVYQCMCRDFIADKDREWYGENRCAYKDRDKFGFDKDKYSQEWYAETHPYLTMEEYWKDNGCPHWGSCN